MRRTRWASARSSVAGSPLMTNRWLPRSRSDLPSSAKHSSMNCVTRPGRMAPGQQPPIEAEHRRHPLGLRGRRQRRVVVQAQVAAQPEQRTAHRSITGPLAAEQRSGAPPRAPGARTGNRAAATWRDGTRWPVVTICAISPYSSLRVSPGTGSTAGRCRTRPSTVESCAFVTGSGAVTLIGPDASRSSIAHSIAPTTSSRWIHDTLPWPTAGDRDPPIPSLKNRQHLRERAATGRQHNPSPRQ